ncbi:transglycosylase SLT domain-containing protein [Candidatus Chrysopegis kryptomonas]|uniref:Rod binding protein n=1 Tax=Candidatus Chryseopegocella kryptomonas TaxID=1633643 RepID=A0A0P1MX85_9BACT|nr:transglycosylase SLT domain-containing protein [Candidatus Chrysopegis kryptomonas]CUT00393.1 Rod binding protein [Candidatus Chrysopegis kryptomonas]
MKVENKTTQQVSKVNTNQSEARKVRLKEASENFEAIFLNFMLKSMMKISDDKNSIFGGDNFGGDVLDGIFFLEISKHLAKNGKFGIAEMIYKELEARDSKVENLNKQSEGVKKDFKTLQKNEANARKENIKKFLIQRYGVSLVDRIKKFDEIIKKASAEFNVPEELIKAVIAVESSGNVFAVSPKGAKGLMQLVDSTAEFVGVKNVWHPAENIYGGVKYLRYLLDRFNGDLKLALAGYNAGPENVEKFGGIPPFPETIEYVGKVMRYLKLFEENKTVFEDGK